MSMDSRKITIISSQGEYQCSGTSDVVQCSEDNSQQDSSEYNLKKHVKIRSICVYIGFVAIDSCMLCTFIKKYILYLRN